MTRSALVLIDFQIDFLTPEGRMPVCASQIQPALAAAARAFVAHRAAALPVAAIGNEFRRGDHLMNVLRRYAALQGSLGAAWDPRLRLDGAAYFPKWASSAFVNPDFEAWLKAQAVEALTLCGLKAAACITSTARDAMARGYRVTLIGEAIACSSERSKARALRRLSRAGATLAA